MRKHFLLPGARTSASTGVHAGVVLGSFITSAMTPSSLLG
jgi:hypothetical protein